MSAAVQADNVNRTMEQVTKDIALVKEQFNQIVPENDLKWAAHPSHAGPDGYDFAPADAFVNFGLSNNMYHRGTHARLARPDAQLGLRRHEFAAGDDQHRPPRRGHECGSRKRRRGVAEAAAVAV